jgi:hypothetical protein
MELKVRTLKHVKTLVFETDDLGSATLLRLLADYLDASKGTLQAVTFNNSDDDGEYREWITAYVECPYPETIDWSADLDA